MDEWPVQDIRWMAWILLTRMVNRVSQYYELNRRRTVSVPGEKNAKQSEQLTFFDSAFLFFFLFRWWISFTDHPEWKDRRSFGYAEQRYHLSTAWREMESLCKSKKITENNLMRFQSETSVSKSFKRRVEGYSVHNRFLSFVSRASFTGAYYLQFFTFWASAWLYISDHDILIQRE